MELITCLVRDISIQGFKYNVPISWITKLIVSLYILYILIHCLFFFHSLFQSSIAAGLTANGWINEIVPLIKGKGGGKEASAQATGTNTGALKEAMDIATKFAGLKLS